MSMDGSVEVWMNGVRAFSGLVEIREAAIRQAAYHVQLTGAART